MKKLLFAGLSVLFLVGCSEETNENSDNSVAVEAKEEKEYFKDNYLKLNDFEIKITQTKIIQPGEEGNKHGKNPVFAIWYDTTNLSDKEITSLAAWIITFDAIQDNDPNTVNELRLGVAPDDQFLSTSAEIIKKDGTVSNAVAYVLDDLETPVTLVATQVLDKIGEQTFEIK